MNTTSQEFGLFIDNIRSSRNMSREDFVDGILSTRQFQRYLKGESSISMANLVMLIDKLELDFFSIYNRFLKSSSIEHSMINNIYHHLMSLEYKEAFDIIQNHKNHNFTSLYYQKLFNIYETITKQKLLRISEEMAINYIKKEINYSKCMETEEINYIELTSLLYIAQIVKDEEKKQNITSKLFNVLKNHKISDFDEKNPGLVFVYSAFSKLLGIEKEYDKVIFLTKKGVDLCMLNKTTNSLAHLYYYCALGYLGQNNKTKAFHYVKKAFFTLELEDTPLRYNAFIKLFESHFSIKFNEFKTW